MICCDKNGTSVLFLPKPMKMKVLVVSHVQLCATPWAVAHQAPLYMGLSRQEYRSGLPFLSPGDLLDPGIEPASLTSAALAGGFFTMSVAKTHNPSLIMRKTSDKFQ